MLCYLTEGNVPDLVCVISLPVLADDRSHVLVAENAAARLHPAFPTPCHLPEQRHQCLAKSPSIHFPLAFGVLAVAWNKGVASFVHPPNFKMVSKILFSSYPIKFAHSPAVSSEGSVGSAGAPCLQPLLRVGRGFWGWGLLLVTGRVIPMSSWFGTLLQAVWEALGWEITSMGLLLGCCCGQC